MFCFLSSQLTIGDRLGPARVRGRVIVHQIKVDLSHHGVQLSSLLPIAVSWEQLIYDGLSPDQVITDRGEKKSLGRYRNIDLSSQCFLRAQREMRKHRQSHHRVWKHSSCPQTASKQQQTDQVIHTQKQTIKKSRCVVFLLLTYR